MESLKERGLTLARRDGKRLHNLRTFNTRANTEMTQFSKDVSDVELAKRIKELKGITAADNFETILKLLVPTEKIDTINRIINGLSQEDEFALLCKMLECCSSITPLHQTPIMNENEITPDFQATFHPASFLSNVSSYEAPPFKCMVEVKSTEKLKFKCSRSDIEKRKRFAERYDLPLIYAIRFTAIKSHAYWIIVTADDLYKKNRVDSSDYVDSITPLLFDNYSIFTNSSYTFIRKYSTNNDGIGERHPKLGNLQSVELISEAGKVYQPSAADSLLLAMLFNAFGSTKSYSETYRGESVVYSAFRIQNTLTLVDTIYFLNNLVSDEEGNKFYSPDRAMANLDSPTNPTKLFTRSSIERLIRRTNEACSDFFLFGMLGEIETHRKRVDKVAKLMGISAPPNQK